MYRFPRRETGCTIKPTTGCTAEQSTSTMTQAYSRRRGSEPRNRRRRSRSTQTTNWPQQHAKSTRVPEILNAMREGPEALCQPELNKVLEQALRDVWNKILDNPQTYIMTRDEFALFNFFQHLELNEEVKLIAQGARYNYWKNLWGPLKSNVIS
ncbi:uncharacterized protein F4807DRAFT_435561 [Annulohypoxylon truncatum]|uniref:uncharacterized protein n=1 Tax=Annulohypoxylon truncatum TaxID=327061 RepID=UPI002007CE65|nr:uncharacterized protein F4807DRAFT_435561 [Annulohypoxylon truncatum]KAI1207374.1 hypothetical protein F4807DRAFT_435561 [Annulohypoxylon truncatum]